MDRVNTSQQAKSILESAAAKAYRKREENPVARNSDRQVSSHSVRVRGHVAPNSADGPANLAAIVP